MDRVYMAIKMWKYDDDILLDILLTILERISLCDRYIMYINSIIHLKPISRTSPVYFCFYKQNIVFEANVMFDGQNWELASIKKCNISKSASLISWKWLGVDSSNSQFPSAYVWFKQQNLSNIIAKAKLFWKICYPYTAIALVPSLVKHALCYAWNGIGITP